MKNDVYNLFGITNEDSLSWKTTSTWGSMINKVIELFEYDHKNPEIKARIQDGKFVSEYFPPYLIGATQTWNYIIDSLYFWGLIKSRKYSDSKIEEGYKIFEFLKYKTFDDYIASDDAYKNIMRNFNESEKSKKWYKNKIIASKFYKDGRRDFPTHGRFKGVWEFLEILTSSNSVSEYDDEIIRLSDEIINYEIPEAKRMVEKNSSVEKLRRKFAESLDIEFKEKKDHLKVIGEYANTFNLEHNIQVSDKAHIIPVFYLVKKKRFKDITDNNNGIILDPNTHRILDNDKNAKFDIDNFSIIHSTGEYKMNQSFKNQERLKYMIEYNKIIGDIK